MNTEHSKTSQLKKTSKAKQMNVIRINFRNKVPIYTAVECLEI